VSNPANLLGQRLAELHQVIEEFRKAEERAIEARQTADVEESKEFLKATGSIEARKHLARIQCERLEFDALVAEAHVRHVGRLYKEAQLRVEAGRTYSADLRAELQALGSRDGSA